MKTLLLNFFIIIRVVEIMSIHWYKGSRRISASDCPHQRRAVGRYARMCKSSFSSTLTTPIRRLHEPSVIKPACCHLRMICEPYLQRIGLIEHSQLGILLHIFSPSDVRIRLEFPSVALLSHFLPGLPHEDLSDTI